MTMVSSPSRSSSMASRRSHSIHAGTSPSSSELTLALPNVVQGFLPSPDLGASQDTLAHSPPQDADNLAIAPWLAPEPEGHSEPPTPPPKQQRFGFASKTSMGSFSAPRQPSMSMSTLSLASTRTADTSSILSGDTIVDARKSKTSLTLLPFLRKRSRSKLRSDERPPEEPIPPMPPSPPPSIKRAIKKSSANRTLPISRQSQTRFVLDTNFDNINDIVDLSARPSQDLTDPSPAADSASPESGTAASAFEYLGISPSSLFTDPFQPTSPRVAGPSTINYDSRKISPKAKVPEPAREGAESPTWTAPESWAVEKGEEEEAPAQEQSSEEEDVAAPDPRLKRRRLTKTESVPRKRSVVGPSSKIYNIRIYRPNGTYHVAKIEADVTVAELKPVLDKRLLHDPSAETHRLYLKERGRERVLALNERPASILRRRLEQAGYLPSDGLNSVGREDTQFLLRFTYKSNVLGTAEEDACVDSSGLIELTGRGLRTVPIALYTRADGIVSLNLSRNPMVEIPLDFIQSCTQLRELRLQNMAMKKVPQSVRHCRTLHRLDLSSNRIADLEDAGLNSIPELQALKLQNNRLERLPHWFPHLRALRDLNISNNHFRHLPAAVSEIRSLVDLDISFNSISELPDEIGQLSALERFIIVGNQVRRFPASVRALAGLRMFDCRRNHIPNLAAIAALPRVEQIYADHNTVHALDLALGPALQELVVSHNDITQINLIPGPHARPFALTHLDISHAKLAALDEGALAQLTALRTLRVDNNELRSIPESLGSLAALVHISCSNNRIRSLPPSLGQLQKLETLEAHNNALTELPSTLWGCPSLQLINATSNFVSHWRLPHLSLCESTSDHTFPDLAKGEYGERKSSWASTSASGRSLPPLAAALEKLYLGENKLTDDSILPLSLLKELRVLNLSFNEIQDLPGNFLRNLTKLRELYLSGNSLSGIPTEDLYRLTSLEVLFLNGNKLQSLPKELNKVPSLTALDVGSNILRYNVFNWEFDWNWNFNKKLRYLNMSGNKRLEIRPDMSKGKEPKVDADGRQLLADFSKLEELRVLGLMDVTWTGNNIPDENEERRIRTSSSEVNSMGYGIADTLGVTDHINMLDLVQPVFRDRKNEAVFAMFGRASHAHTNHLLNKFLHVDLVDALTDELKKIDPSRGEGITDAMRRTFLRLNKDVHTELCKHMQKQMKGDLQEEIFARRGSNRKMSTVSASTLAMPLDTRIRGGASGIVLYFVDKTLYVANVGDALAVVSRHGDAELLSFKHDPFDRQETARIRATEGWVSPKGFVNDDIEVARSFGFYDLVPVVNATPHVRAWQLNELDEFVIVGNSGLWDFVSYQTAVDIARTEKADPMIAAQKLRDFAISYGAEGTTMIMVISVADLFNQRSRMPTVDFVNDAEELRMIKQLRRKEPEIGDRVLSRLGKEVPPPVGHVALVFTDIRNSTHLWEVNPGMPTAMSLHNSLLRRQLRLCGGYEVKTEGDAFMCSFPTALSALWWAMIVQVQLLNVDWPLELLECEDGKEIYDQSGHLIARGLSVRIGIHCGNPVCEPDPVTKRMDYFGPMVNRASRVEGKAAGGQIMCSADVVREIRACVYEEEDSSTEWSHLQPKHAVEGIRRMGVNIVSVGEVKLKGLEAPEVLSAVYPTQLAERHALCEAQSTSSKSRSRVQFSVEQMTELALLCLRLEALATSRILRPTAQPKAGTRTSQIRPASIHGGSNIVSLDPRVLMPAMENASDVELLMLLDSLTTRIENALNTISVNRVLSSGVLQTLTDPHSGTLQAILAMLSPASVPSS